MLEELKSSLIEYGHLMTVMGMNYGISGNLSARYGKNMLITSSGSANGYLTEKDFSLIDKKGNVIEGNPKPSSEKFLHIEYYKIRPDINCVIHVHSPYLTAFATAGIPLEDGISPEIIYCFDKIPLAKYATPSSNELVEKTSTYFDEHDIVLMENHGVIAAGATIKDTYLKLELAEGYAKTLICTKILGGAKILDDNDIKKIKLLRH